MPALSPARSLPHPSAALRLSPSPASLRPFSFSLAPPPLPPSLPCRPAPRSCARLFTHLLADSPGPLWPLRLSLVPPAPLFMRRRIVGVPCKPARSCLRSAAASLFSGYSPGGRLDSLRRDQVLGMAAGRVAG